MESKELTRAKKLMYKGKFSEALDIILICEKKVLKHSSEKLSLLILKGRICIYSYRYKEAVEVGELAGRLSKKLNISENHIQLLLIKAHVAFLGDIETALNLIDNSEKILHRLSVETSLEYPQLQVDLMLIKIFVYSLNDDLTAALNMSLQWLKLYEKTAEKLDLARIYEAMANIYVYKDELNKALEFAMKNLEIQKQLSNIIGKANSYCLIGLINYKNGDFDSALDFSKKSLASEELSTKAKLDSLHVLGAIYKDRGELDRTLRFYGRAMKLAEKEKYIDEFTANIMGIGATYRMKGNLQLAEDYIKRSLKLSKTNNSLYGINASLFYLVLINLDKNSLEQAQIYLSKLEKFTDKIEIKVFIHTYLIAKALVLKKSNRIRDRAESEALLKQIVESKTSTPHLFLLASVNLCELFLGELKQTNNTEIISEINQYLTKIYEKAKLHKSYLWLADLKLLQAKLALIQMETDESKQLLTEAQRIAEMHRLNLLAQKISSEHDKLLDQLELWENLKSKNAPMSERLKLASIGGVLDRLQGRQTVEVTDSHPEIPVLLLIIGEGGIPVLSHPFTKEISFEDGIISGFLSAFNSFGGELFSKGLDRAKFGEYIIHIQTIGSFSLCYLFKGQTYSAKLRLNHFKDQIQKTPPIWEKLNNYFQSGQLIQPASVPLLEDLINQTFS